MPYDREMVGNAPRTVWLERLGQTTLILKERYRNDFRIFLIEIRRMLSQQATGGEDMVNCSPPVLAVVPSPCDPTEDRFADSVGGLLS